MNNSINKITLDLQDQRSAVLVNVRKGDCARTFEFYFTDGGKPYALSDNCTVIFRAKKPDGTILFNNCVIDENVASYKVTTQTTSAVGIVECEVELIDGDLVTAPRFYIRVDDTLYSDSEVESQDEFTELTTAINEVKTTNSKIFRAVFDQTSYDEIASAVEDGDKVICAVRRGIEYSFDGISSDTAYFSSLGTGQSQKKYVIKVNSTGW